MSDPTNSPHPAALQGLFLRVALHIERAPLVSILVAMPTAFFTSVGAFSLLSDVFERLLQ